MSNKRPITDPEPIPNLASGEYDYEKRNALAKGVIEKYTRTTSTTGGAIGLGTLAAGLIPGAGVAAIGLALVAQSTALQPMILELSRIYQTPHSHSLEKIIDEPALGEAGKSLVKEMDGGFLRWTAVDFRTELATSSAVTMGIVGGFIPVLGSLVSAGLNMATAATLSWRIGTTVAMYYQNGGRWVGSREETYQRAKLLAGALSFRMANRVDLNSLRTDPDIFRYQVQQTTEYVRGMLTPAPAPPIAEFRRVLCRRHYPEDIAEAALANVFGRMEDNLEAFVYAQFLQTFRKLIDENNRAQVFQELGYSPEAVHAALPSSRRDVAVQRETEEVERLDKIFDELGKAISEGSTVGVRRAEDFLAAVAMALRAAIPDQDTQDNLIDNFDNLFHNIIDEIRRKVDDVPVEQPDLSQAIAAFQQAMAPIDAARLELAPAFQTHFNALARALPMATYKEKQFWVKILNAALRSRGYSVKCPNTGKPSFILVDQGTYPTIGRFRFAHAAGKKTAITASSNELPEFEIVLDDINLTIEEGESKIWAEKKGSPGKRGEDGRE